MRDFEQLWQKGVWEPRSTLRPLVSSNATPDEKVPLIPSKLAICSVLQFGAIVPPLSPWEGFSTEPTSPQLLTGHTAPRTSFPAGFTEAALITRLDHEIARCLSPSERPVVLFSGGVDSSLIAARLKHMGRDDTLLLHLSFGSDDTETQCASEIAASLGLAMEKHIFPKNSIRCLENPGHHWPAPFGDWSTAPSAELGWWAADRLRGIKARVFDGTGADALFGLSCRLGPWRKVYQTPQSIRRIARTIYQGSFWKSTGRLERALRILGRASQLPIGPAVVAQNPLAGAFYDDRSVDLMAVMAQWFPDALAADPASILSLDAALTCTRVFAQKSLPLLEAAQISVSFPFLGRTVLAHALHTAPSQQEAAPKLHLKTALAKCVPEALVFRKKSAFLDPRALLFRNPIIPDLLRRSVESSSPLASCLHASRILQLCDHLSRHRPIPDQTRNFVWTLAFTTRWFDTFDAHPSCERLAS